jgi:hypothetical protein
MILTLEILQAGKKLRTVVVKMDSIGLEAAKKLWEAEHTLNSLPGADLRVHFHLTEELNMLYQLICEGRCNPDRVSVDATVRLERAQFERVVSQEVYDRLRALKYTPHEMINPIEAECLDCHTIRRYGSH